MQEFITSEKSSGTEILISGFIFCTAFGVWNVINNESVDILTLFMFIILFILMFFALYYTGRINPLKKILRSETSLITEQKIFFKKFHKCFNIEETDYIRISVGNFITRSFAVSEIYSKIDVVIIFKNGGNYSFMFRTDRSKLNDKIIELQDFLTGIKITLGDFYGYNAQETREQIEAALKYNGYNE